MLVCVRAACTYVTRQDSPSVTKSPGTRLYRDLIQLCILNSSDHSSRVRRRWTDAQTVREARARNARAVILPESDCPVSLRTVHGRVAIWAYVRTSTLCYWLCGVGNVVNFAEHISCPCLSAPCTAGTAKELDRDVPAVPASLSSRGLEETSRRTGRQGSMGGCSNKNFVCSCFPG